MKIVTEAQSLLYLGIFLLLMAACKSETAETPTASIDTNDKYPEITALNQRIVDNPNDANLYFARAQSYAQLEGYDEAIADLAKAIRIDSTNLDYHHLLADVYLNYAQSYRAILTLQRAVNLHPEDIPTKLKLSKFHIILKQYPESLKIIQAILKQDPENAEAFFMMGLTFREEGKTDNAINAFQTAVENEPDLIDAWIILGKLFYGKDDPRALQYFDNAVRLAPTNIAAHHTRANYLQQTGQLVEAIQAYRKINILDPDYSDAYFNSGLAYIELDSIDKAYKHFDLVVKTDPTNAQGYYFRGVTSSMQGKATQAKQDFQQSLKFDPDSEKVKEALANLEKQMEEKSE